LVHIVATRGFDLYQYRIEKKNGTTSVLYAFGEEDPDGEDPPYHAANRGSQSLMILDPPPGKQTIGVLYYALFFFLTATILIGEFPDDESVKTFEFRMPSVLIPHEVDTTYWCIVFKGPSVDTPHQFIGVQHD
jgi:hypothetical protein